MSKHEDLLQKEAEKLARITHEKNREYQPSLDPWEKLSEREQYIKTEMQYEAARYVLEARAESYKKGHDQGTYDEAFGGRLLVQDHLQSEGYLPTEKEA